MSASDQFPRATLIKRLAAMIYDALVALAVAVSSGIVITLVLILLLENNILSMQGAEHTKDVIQSSVVYQTIIQVWVGFWVLGFFLWFWTHGGQTIGMRAWRIRLHSCNNKPLTYSRMLLRVLTALGGIGTLFIIFNPRKKRALQDIATQTEVLQLTKEANHHRTWKGLNN